MGIQYSGAAYSSTFTTTTGTRREIVDNMAAKLVAAGWSYQSGSGTGDVKMITATTAQGLKTVVRINDPGSGNCALFRLYNSANTVNQAGGCYLLPSAGKIFRIIANPYQFAVFCTNSTTAREFIMGGTPWIPSWNSGITEAGWLHGNATTDSDTTVRGSFRTIPQVYDNAFTPGNQCAYINTTLMEGNNSNFGVAYSPGVIQLAGYTALDWQSNNGTAAMMNKWYDGSMIVSEPLIGWCNSTTPASTDAIIVGQLWDAALSTTLNPPDVTTTFDSHTWQNIMSSNGGINARYNRCSLWLATT